ncbi:hypothetical protein [Maritimibacter sp. UBA3975]|uniref:hypothetical protein n=1 Tax=Maritimibacter sp. UBA3975 TaxID=1946833 RepID=UPI000C09AE4D|nr:hypothetical protein [Maritimibacter sp. UBA3975]MAM60864.1 hypothetical protein [Maritimibacter sp.]|tara:strand:+ start:14843 stop:15331 length:489 start_codon:yes stop_codon:yes gene_type:complete
MSDNFIGRTIYVAESAPATNDTTGFEALTWVQVKGAQVMPQLGVTHSNIDVDDLGTGFSSGVKGMGSGRESTLQFRTIASDAGQEDVLGLAADQDGIGAVKICKGTGTDSGDGPAVQTGDVVEYAHGYFHSAEPNTPDGSSHEGWTVTFKQNAATITGVEPS